MSKVAIKGAASGTATFTIESPATNTDRTLVLPDVAGTVALTTDIPAAYTDTDALDLFNASGSAPVFACRAFVNFNGTGTVAIRASGNVSSITDNGSGDYTVNFATAMPDANYAAEVTGLVDVSSVSFQFFAGIHASNGTPSLKTTTQIRVVSSTLGALEVDSLQMNVSIFR